VTERELRDAIARRTHARPRVLCFGEVGWDIAERDGAEVAAGPGGCALNTAYALAFLGAHVTLSGNPVGADTMGDAIVADLGARGIDAMVPRRADIHTPSCLCRVDAAGERTFVTSHADIGTAARDFVPEILRRIRSGTYAQLFVQPYIGDLSRELLQAIQDVSVPIVMQDLDSASAFLELGDTLQISLDDADDFSAAAVAAYARPYFRGRLGELILTAGARGVAVVGRAASPRLYPAVPVAAPVDTTGCGDAFRAGLMYARACGDSRDDAIALGQLVGALKACIAGSTITA
jgi:ribokinase